MVTVTPISDAQTSYTGSSGRASTKYKAKVLTVSDWQSKATSAAAESNYAAGVSNAVSSGRRAKALSRVTNSDWQQRASTKGANSIGTGISQSGDKWNKGAAPYFQTLSGVSLPERTTDGKQNLINRAGAVVDAMIAKKKELKG